jgi:hypothetical protein
MTTATATLNIIQI